MSMRSSQRFAVVAFCLLFLATDRVQVQGLPDILGTASTSSPSASSSSSMPLPKNGGGDTGTDNSQPTFLHDLFYGTPDKKQMMEEMVSHSTLAGSFKPAIRKLLVSKEEGKDLLQTISHMVHWEDLILILVAGWLVVPSIEFPYSRLPINLKSAVPFHKTYLYAVANHLQQVAKIALAVYIMDIVQMFCVGVGFEFCQFSKFPHFFAQAAYSLWAANRVCRVKKHLLRQHVNRHPETFGRIQIVNRLVDAMVYGGTIFVILNIFKVEMGVAMSGFLAFGSVGTLAIGLASKDLASNILNGLMLSASDRIYEGDSVQFGTGQSGTILKLGWFETVLRGSDEIMVSIPNGDMLQRQVSNLSRVRFCQVKQMLRFPYKDADKLPALFNAIKEEIRLACPALITDGSRPFRAYWTDYNDEYLGVMVDTHFHLKPIGDEYWENRQRVLQAIDKAVKKVGVSFHTEAT
jgi:small-conductance mechanosensitive channel